MDIETTQSESEYQKQDRQAKEKIKKIEDKSKVLKEMSSEMKIKDDPKYKMNCRLADMVFHESMDMYREGEMTFDEMIEDLYKSLKAIR